MRALLPIAILALGAAAPVDNPRTYLVSLSNFGLEPAERVESFSITTWGVEFKAVCHIPGGWRIKAGNSASPDGELEGEGSEGVTWLGQGHLNELHNFVLITLYGPVQRHDLPLKDGLVPATFKGHATVTFERDRRVRLTFANVVLTPATGCPAPTS